jgi:cytochrome P450
VAVDQEIRLFSGQAREDPYALYAQLREQSPVYREPEFGTYVLTRFADVYGALKDHATFSSSQGISPGLQSTSGALMTSMITTDPPRHSRLRALVNRSFTPRVLGNLEPWLSNLVDELLDAFADTEDVEVVRALTVPLPVMAIARVLGIPPEDRERFKEWSDAVVGATDRAIPEEEREKIREMMRYFAATIAARKESPQDDLVSTIAFAEVDGERLTDLEMLGFCLLLLIAGNETTTNLLSNVLHLLARRPDLWAQLREDPSRVRSAVEEGLRYDSPVQMLFRTTTGDIEMHGQTIPAGARVAVGYAAGNRDGREFSDPDEFRLDRGLLQHIAFGHGIHYCLGAPLARLEARVALERLTARFATITAGGGHPRRVPSAILRGFESLPLRFAK